MFDIYSKADTNDLQNIIYYKTLYGKIEKTLELICPLYRHNLITDAYIVGSVAKGTFTKESDIDILIINPILHNAADLPPNHIILPYTQSEEERIVESLRLDITNILKNIGVEFKEIYLKDIDLWYQFYKGEIFHIMTRKRFENFDQHIQITKDMCQ